MGEVITLSSNVSKFDENRPLQITMFDPSEKVILNEKIPVNSDGIFSYDITNNEKMKMKGTYSIRAQYGKSNSEVEKISFMIKIDDISNTVSESTTNIPVWIKNNAGWWADGSIDDNSFVQGIQFLVKEGIITIDQNTK